MKSRVYFILAIFCLVFFSATTFGQKSQKCDSITYEDKNQVTPPALTIMKVKGLVLIDDGKIPLGDSCVALFSADGKKLIATTLPNRKGEFRFKNIANGQYRLIIKHHFGFYCVANILVTINANRHDNSNLLVLMKPEGIDECSLVRLET